MIASIFFVITFIQRRFTKQAYKGPQSRTQISPKYMYKHRQGLSEKRGRERKKSSDAEKEGEKERRIVMQKKRERKKEEQ